MNGFERTKKKCTCSTCGKAGHNKRRTTGQCLLEKGKPRRNMSLNLRYIERDDLRGRYSVHYVGYSKLKVHYTSWLQVIFMVAS